MIVNEFTGQFITDQQEAVRQSIRRRLLTEYASRPMRPTYGTGILSLIGSNPTPDVISLLTAQVRQAVEGLLVDAQVVVTQPAFDRLIVYVNGTEVMTLRLA